MAKHTPGPWEYRDSMDGGCMTYCNYNGCPETHPTGYFLIDGPQWDQEAAYAYGAVTRNEADAALIAAAPDLLAACRMIEAMAVHGEPLSVGDIAEVRAAIAKAEGTK